MNSIDRINIRNTGIDQTQAAQPKEQVRGEDREQTSPAARDSVALSSKAKEIDRFASLIEQSREQRLNELRQRLENGTYYVSGNDIAQKVVEFNGKP